MRIALGIDLGSTSVTIAAVRVDDDTSELLAARSAPNDAEITAASDRLIGRSEWNLDQMVERAALTARDLVSGIDSSQVVAIGVTGQQQGCQLLDQDGKGLGPFIAWQDQRGKDRMPDREGTFLDAMAERGGATRRGNGLPTFQNAGCPIVTGYTAPTLFWLQHMNMLPAQAATAITAPEYLAHKLVDSPRPVTDATDAAGWGVLNVPERRWNDELIDGLDIDRSMFPEIVDSCTVAGGLTETMSDIIGIAAGTPVSVPSGDHQCSFAGAVKDADDTLAINIGTGGQATVYIGDLSVLSRSADCESFDHGWLELRPHIESGYLLAGVGVVGGRTYRALKDFFVRSARDVFDLEYVDDDEVYRRLAELAAVEMSNASDSAVTASALFTGSRENPDARGRFDGITPGNFTPGAMALAVFRSMAYELANSYRSAVGLGAGMRRRVTGSGNGLRLNPTLRQCLEEELEQPIAIGSLHEEAAVGAGLTAAVAVGIYADIGEASETLVR